MISTQDVRFIMSSLLSRVKKMTVLSLVGIGVLFILFAGGCSYLNRKAGLQDDHLLEETVEVLIEYKTGVDLDLTPESAE